MTSQAVYFRFVSRPAESNERFDWLKKSPPPEIAVPALTSQNIPIGGEHSFVSFTGQANSLHDGERISATFTVVVEGSVQDRAERHPRLSLWFVAETLAPRQENMLEKKQKEYFDWLLVVIRGIGNISRHISASKKKSISKKCMVYLRPYYLRGSRDLGSNLFWPMKRRPT